LAKKDSNLLGLWGGKARPGPNLFEKKKGKKKSRGEKGGGTGKKTS